MHGLAMARLSSIGRAMAVHCEARHSDARQRSSYEVNCCAVAMHREAWCSAVAEHGGAAALRSTDRQGEGIASRARRREGMAEKSADVICEGKVVHRNVSLRQGFASDALAWQRDTPRRQSKEKAFY